MQATSDAADRDWMQAVNDPNDTPVNIACTNFGLSSAGLTELCRVTAVQLPDTLFNTSAVMR